MSTCDCESGESGYGKHNGWNSRDHWPETFSERTVFASEFEVPSMCENTKNECLCTVPLFCFLSVLPLEKGHVCLSSWWCVSVQLFTELFTLLHAVVSVQAQFTTMYALAQAQGCVVRIKTRSSPCHPCLHLRISFALTLHLSHSHLLPRSLHQEQPLRSSCRSTNTALLRQMRSLALWPIQPLPQVMSPT